GLDFLERLMRLRPMPVIMISSLTQRHSEISMRALELGAVDVIGKPTQGGAQGMMMYSDYIADRVRAAAISRPRAGSLFTQAKKPNRPTLPAGHFPSLNQWLIAIGASTG